LAVDTIHAGKQGDCQGPRVAVRMFARKDPEEKKHDSSARVKERQRRGAHVRGMPERVDMGWRARPTPTPRAETFSAAGYGARVASQAEEVCDRNDPADYNKRGLRVEEDQASAERSAVLGGAHRNQGWSDAMAARAAARK
jgi:hypothetical protein